MKEKITPIREQKEQLSTFIREVYDFNYKGGRVILSGAGFAYQRLACSAKNLEKQAFQLLQETGAAYASLNVYKPQVGHCRRTSEYLWRLGHIVIDIDFKGAYVPDYAALEAELERHILWQSTYGDIPMPNHIVFTGSGGCHLYYLFEDLPNGKEGRMEQGIQATKMQLIARWVPIEKALQDEGLEFKVDTTAVDSSRVFRVPGSIHEDTGRMCRMKEIRSARYVYKELCRSLMEKPWKGEYAINSAYRDIERTRNGYGQKPYEADKFVVSKKGLGIKRLKELMGLAQSGWRFEHCRELSAHFVWVWGKDAGWSDEEIQDWLLELNGYFHEPLCERELFRTAKGNGKSYRYTNERIRLNLGLDGSEGYFTGHPLRKCKDRAGKTRLHKKLIAALVLAGKKIREIAQELRLSISLVKRRRTEMNKAEGFGFWATVPV